MIEFRCFLTLWCCLLAGISFHPSGGFLASSSLDATIKIWDLRQGTLFYTLSGHEGATLGLDFSPAGDFFASGGADDQVMVWKTNFDRDLDEFAIVPPAKRHSNKLDATKPSLPVAQQENLDAKQEVPVQVKQNDVRRRGRTGKREPIDSSCTDLKSAHVPETIEESRKSTSSCLPGSNSSGEQEKNTVLTLDEILGENNKCPVTLPSPLDLQSIPQPLAATLQHIIGELNVVSQTLGLVVQRLTINEDRVRRLEQSTLHKSESPTRGKGGETNSEAN